MQSQQPVGADHGTLGVDQGTDQRTSLAILLRDIRTKERELLRRRMEKRPGRIKTACFLLTVEMILMFMCRW